MNITPIVYWQRFLRLLLACVTAFSILAPASITPASAASGDRALYLYYTHTKETAKITFKRNGRYDKKGLAQLNQFLRDWRRNEPTKMDPALFDLIWEVYQKSGASKPIHVVSAYRSPKTNEMLRARSRAVAKNSRHTMGMAMDFFIPGIKISNLRRIAMGKQVGGVGYYPSAGNPFVHLDTGNVRAWPRMTTAQLKKVFPNGKTLHMPNNGVPLSQKGYQQAKAEWVKCHAVPCNGRRSTGSSIRVADNSKSGSSDSGSKSTLLGWLFGGDEDATSETGAVVAASTGPTQRTVPSVAITAPTPMDRPGFIGTTLVATNAPIPAPRPQSLDRLDGNALGGLIAVAAAESLANPAPRTLLSAGRDGTPNPLLTAYAPTSVPEPNAQRALQMLIEQRARNVAAGNTRLSTAMPSKLPLSQQALESLPELRPVTYEIASDGIQTASISNRPGIKDIGNLFDSTWTAVSSAGVPAEPKLAPALINVAQRKFELVAPDLEHITETFADPQLITSERYAMIFDLDEADFNPATELGKHGRYASLSADPAWGLDMYRFTNRAPMLVATR